MRYVQQRDPPESSRASDRSREPLIHALRRLSDDQRKISVLIPGGVRCPWRQCFALWICESCRGLQHSIPWRTFAATSAQRESFNCGCSAAAGQDEGKVQTPGFGDKLSPAPLGCGANPDRVNEDDKRFENRGAWQAADMEHPLESIGVRAVTQDILAAFAFRRGGTVLGSVLVLPFLFWCRNVRTRR